MVLIACFCLSRLILESSTISMWSLGRLILILLSFMGSSDILRHSPKVSLELPDLVSCIGDFFSRTLPKPFPRLDWFSLKARSFFVS